MPVTALLVLTSWFMLALPYVFLSSKYPTLIELQITTGQFQYLTYRVITMVRGGLISMLYGKTAELSINATDPASSMILMSADIERITTGWQTMHELWANLIEVGLAIYLLEIQLGAACAVPIAVALGKHLITCLALPC
jgi:ATP-binding cassette subfamily C (CFTR/MRP) protein 1